jgi:hypothetical protein
MRASWSSNSQNQYEDRRGLRSRRHCSRFGSLTALEPSHVQQQEKHCRCFGSKASPNCILHRPLGVLWIKFHLWQYDREVMQNVLAKLSRWNPFPKLVSISEPEDNLALDNRRFLNLFCALKFQVLENKPLAEQRNQIFRHIHYLYPNPDPKKQRTLHYNGYNYFGFSSFEHCQVAIWIYNRSQNQRSAAWRT